MAASNPVEQPATAVEQVHFVFQELSNSDESARDDQQKMATLAF